MKILVVEDTLVHCQSAIQTLSGHDLTIARDYKNAMRCLGGDELGRDKPMPDPFDVVLSDMMMAGDQSSNNTASHPYGFAIVLAAALRGVKYVALLTDINHHHDGMSSALDAIAPMYYRDDFTPNFLINGAKAMFVHAPFIDFKVIEGAPCPGCVVPEEETYLGIHHFPLSSPPGVCSTCQGKAVGADGKACWACRDSPGKCDKCKGYGKIDKKLHGKDWGLALQNLLAD